MIVQGVLVVQAETPLPIFGACRILPCLRMANASLVPSTVQFSDADSPSPTSIPAYLALIFRLLPFLEIYLNIRNPETQDSYSYSAFLI